MQLIYDAKKEVQNIFIQVLLLLLLLLVISDQSLSLLGDLNLLFF